MKMSYYVLVIFDNFSYCKAFNRTRKFHNIHVNQRAFIIKNEITFASN
jgi:hypothetical protein